MLVSSFLCWDGFMKQAATIFGWHKPRQLFVKMPKRKREESNEAPAIDLGAQRLTIRAARLEQKIEHGIQQIHRALKTARGFERQKLGRRQKHAQSKNENALLFRLSEEVQALKSLDLLEVSRKHLIKQLMKTKRIAESIVFTQLDISKQHVFNGKKEGPEANVTARLFSSNPVKAVIPGIMDGIRGLLGLENAKSPTHRPSTGEKSSQSLKMAAPKTQPRIETPGVNPEDVSMDEEGNDFDFSQFDDRLASSSGSESEDDDGNTVQRREERRYDPIEDLSLSPTPSTTDSKSPPATVVKSSKSSKATQKPSTTTFLPSLTMGGYWSGTESDAEDDIAAAAITPRKNRMGQQARRKLWEKKFGANANHVRKQTESRNRDSGWDLRRGAMSQEDIGRGRGKGGKFRGQFKTHDEPSTQNERPRNPRGVVKRDQDQGPLHPSWEAAKKAKEKKSQANFQGKKVVFD
ncbi:hypothetical protein CIRG_01446 [Coccidioides immitis RMSCC 2394]|uniref:Bud22 domain-containing protein n=1 Tax=Coccidioides immitis RMSCC 2394 TaxID=404692 RepID=A0A0J6XYF9_COCIT|nr:hypothetical protein CIRG_01446 [Coccidioides immitis RMSCC 2394]